METPSIACGQKGQAGLICLMDPAEETWGLHSFMVFPPKLLGPKGKVPLSGEPYSIVTPHESAAPSHLSWPGAGGGGRGMLRTTQTALGRGFPKVMGS